jgi:hypothetical protein
MRKVWRYVLFSFLALVLVGAGTVYYFFEVKSYEIEDETVREIIETVYEIILPGDSDYVEPALVEQQQPDDSQPTEANPDDPEEDNSSNPSSQNDRPSNAGTTTIAEEETSSQGENSSTKQPNSINPAKPNPNSNTNKSDGKAPAQTNPAEQNQNEAPEKKPAETEAKPTLTVKNIKDQYRPVFYSLQSQANGKLDALVSRAISEYQGKKANGESISYSYFYQKYTTAGRALESQTDDAFYYIYGALENDLKKHGHSTSHATVFKDQYAAAKREREASILSIAKNGL